MKHLQEALAENETIIHQERPHKIIFVRPLAWLAASLISLIIGPFYATMSYRLIGWLSLYQFIAIIFFIAAVMDGAVAYISYISSEFAVTNRRLLVKIGLFERTSFEIFLNRIESISVHQTILGRILNYGSLMIIGLGGTRDFFHNIPAPMQFRQEIKSQIDKFM